MERKARSWQCKKCGTYKPETDEFWYFQKYKNGRRHKDSMCKECRKSYRKSEKALHMKAYYAEHKERYKQHNIRWAEENIEKKMWHSAKGRAKRSNIPFDILPEDIIIPEVCPILNICIDKTYGNAVDKTGWGRNPNRPSIDRIDSSKGYTKENIHVISNRANSLKNDATLDELIKLGEFAKQLKGEVS